MYNGFHTCQVVVWGFFHQQVPLWLSPFFDGACVTPGGGSRSNMAMFAQRDERPRPICLQLELWGQ